MARAIDASELIVEIQACSWDSEQDKERAEDLVLGMPTLTPPNEPLTTERSSSSKPLRRRRSLRHGRMIAYTLS